MIWLTAVMRTALNRWERWDQQSTQLDMKQGVDANETEKELHEVRLEEIRRGVFGKK